MSRAAYQAELLSGVREIMTELGEPIAVGTYQHGQDPVTGDRVDPTFVPLAEPLGVLMALTSEQRAQLLPTAAGVPDRLAAFVAYLPALAFPLTAQHKLRLGGVVYDPVADPVDIGGFGVAWEVHLRAGVE